MSREPWFDRLLEVVEQANKEGRSLRDISRKAGLGPNYVSQMRKEGKAPGAEVVYKLCRALGVSTAYIFNGSPMSAKQELILQTVSSLSERDQDRILELAERLSSPDEEPPEEVRPASRAKGA